MRQKKERKNYFRNEKNRNLWIKLNAERVHYARTLMHEKNNKMGSVDEPYSCMWISKNQLDWDEHESDKPRFSFEELILLQPAELYRIDKRREEEETRKIFEECLRRRKDDQMDNI